MQIVNGVPVIGDTEERAQKWERVADDRYAALISIKHYVDLIDVVLGICDYDIIINTVNFCVSKIKEEVSKNIDD